MSDIAEILAAKTPQSQTCYILLDPSLEERRAELLKNIRKAKAYDEIHNEKDTAPDLEKALVEVEKEIGANRQPFVFRSMGRQAYSTLLDEYKPRDDNAEDEELGFNVDEFPPRLISLSSYEPKIDLGDAVKIWNEWSDGETTLLLGAAVLANKELVDVPFTNDGLPTGTRNTATPSNTALTGDFPTASS